MKQTFELANPFWLRKITTDPHILTNVNTQCPDDKFTLEQATKGPPPHGGKRYSSTLSLTSALDEMGGQRHVPAALPPVKTRYPLYSWLGGPQGRSGRLWNISPPTGNRSPDHSARSESIYRLSYPGPTHPDDRHPKLKICISELILDSYEHIPATHVTTHWVIWP